MKMKQFETYCKGNRLFWFWSDKYWYVVRKVNKGQYREPVGSGKTKDDAYLDMSKLIIVDRG